MFTKNMCRGSQWNYNFYCFSNFLFSVVFNTFQHILSEHFSRKTCTSTNLCINVISQLCHSVAMYKILPAALVIGDFGYQQQIAIVLAMRNLAQRKHSEKLFFPSHFFKKVPFDPVIKSIKKKAPCAMWGLPNEPGCD